MSSLKGRLAKLEAAQPRQPRVDAAITDPMYNRSMETFAAALSDITGAPVTMAEAEQAIKGLSHEQP